MISLYTISGDTRTVFLAAFCVEILLQGCILAYGFFRFRYERKNVWSLLVDLGILLQLGLFILCGAEATGQIRSGVFRVNSYPVLRYSLFCFLAVCSAGKVLACRRWEPVLVIPAAAITLPWAESISGSTFPLLLGISGIFWLLRGLGHLFLYHKERRETLSAFSVKEAVDTMQFGILLCKGSGASPGQILLSNRMMQNLMFRLTGHILYSGRDFYERLQCGQVLPGCIRKGNGPNLMYTLEDESVWRFDLEMLQEGGRTYALLMASDITRYSWTLDQLGRQDEELKVRNLELKEMLRNMESLCRTEETVRTKGRVHDVLGQQISLILRAVREHREPEEELLEMFRGGLPKELKTGAEDCGHALHMVAKSFQSLGVDVTLEGKFPENPELQKAFFEIAAEAMTNAVHHGYATQIEIRFGCEMGQQRMWIRDNGRVKNLPVQEGGGLRSMRRKTEELGGQFSYSTKSHFSIMVSIPEEETV